MDAAKIPEGRPWYRAIYAGDELVGFVMLSWNVPPEPPRIIGPWFLWKLLIDELVVEIVDANGAHELLTSCVREDEGPERFYRRLGGQLVEPSARRIGCSKYESGLGRTDSRRLKQQRIRRDRQVRPSV